MQFNLTTFNTVLYMNNYELTALLVFSISCCSLSCCCCYCRFFFFVRIGCGFCFVYYCWRANAFVWFTINEPWFCVLELCAIIWLHGMFSMPSPFQREREKQPHRNAMLCHAIPPNARSIISYCLAPKSFTVANAETHFHLAVQLSASVLSFVARKTKKKISYW